MGNKFLKLSKEEIAYIAGFLDGDGCVNAQIVQRKDYRLKFQIRVSVTFFQKTKRHWFILFLHKKLGCGTIRKRSDGVSEYAIVGADVVRPLLEILLPSLKIKRKVGVLVLKIIKELSKTQTKDQFYKTCELADQIGELNDSVGRTNKTSLVRSVLEPLSNLVPVETSIK